MTLRTRKPTGQVAWPLVLVEGEEKAGKSAACYRLAASPKVGRTFVFDLGEGTADEYAELGPYEVVEHNGTYTDLYGQLQEACAVPPHEGRPNVVIIDDGTVLWDLLKNWASARAKQSKSGRRTLQADPDAEVDVPMNLWNDASERWEKVLTLLRTWPGIGVLIARGKEVSKVQGGAPVAGQTEWKVEAQKATAGAVSAWVRMRRPHTATLVGVRSLRLHVPSGGLELPNETLDDNPLEHLIFDVLGGAGFVESQRIAPSLADMVAQVEGNGRVDPDERAQADGWDSADHATTAWRALREADLDPAARRRTRLWREKNAAGWTKADHDAVAAAAVWFAAHHQAEVEGGAPFDTPGEEALLDQEALDAYDRHLAGEVAADPGRPFEIVGVDDGPAHRRRPFGTAGETTP